MALNFSIADEPADETTSPEGHPLKLLADLAALFADPARLQREIKRFETAAATAERAQANLATARARHEQFVTTTTAELDERRRKIVEQELDLRRREGMVAASAERQKQTEETLKSRFGLTEVISASGLVREYQNTAPDRPDPHYDGAA
jgi:hypothetical protein